MARIDQIREQFRKGYWTKENVCKDAKKYSSKSEWINANGSAYQVAHRNGWLETACAHMTPKLRTWDMESVRASAQDYSTRAHWKKAVSGAYKAAVRNGWLDEATAHMNLKRSLWTLPELEADARKYATRGTWKEGNGGAYKAALKMGVLDTICGHMDTAYRPAGWWRVKQNVLDSAKKFQTLQMWDAAETSARQAANLHGWIDEATAHMVEKPKPIGAATVHTFLLAHDIPYKAEHRFKDSPEVARMPFDFYVPQHRMIIEYHGRQHKDGWARDKDSLTTIRKNDRIKKTWAMAAGYQFVEIRAWKEKTIGQVRALLTKAFGKELCEPRELTEGELRKIASGYAWDEETLIAEAKRYKSRGEWMLNSPNSYRFALRHGLSAETTQHMPYLTEHGKWTPQSIIKSAKPYSSLSDWRRAEPSAYVIARRLGCFDKATQHMTRSKLPNGYWTNERILAEAARFENTAAWSKGSPVSYCIAKKRSLVPATMPRKYVRRIRPSE